MHDSPQYALLQTIERIRERCCQRLQGLDVYVDSDEVPNATKVLVATIIQRVKRMFQDAEAEAILDVCPIRSFNRNVQQSIEDNWQWLLDDLEAMAKRFSSGDFSPQACESLLEALSSHAVRQQPNKSPTKFHSI